MRRLLAIVMFSVGFGIAYAQTAPATAVAPDYTGGWQVNGEVEGTRFRLLCSLVQTGVKIGGTCSAEAADSQGPQKVAGSVKKGAANFTFDSVFMDNPISVSLSGTLSEDGSKMNGGIDVLPIGVTGDFQAIRLQAPPGRSGSPASPATPDASSVLAPSNAAAHVPAAGPVANAASSVTATWKVIGDVQGTPINMTCDLAQADRVLSGTCKGADNFGHDIVGGVQGTGVSWHFTSNYAGTPITVALTGNVAADGATMTGTMHVMPMDVEGEFNARRQASAR